MDGTSREFAMEGMGLQGLPTGVAGGSGEEITSAEATAPPALSMLDDVTSQPSVMDPSSAAAAEGGGSLPRQASPSSSKAKLPASSRRSGRMRGCRGWRR